MWLRVLISGICAWVLLGAGVSAQPAAPAAPPPPDKYKVALRYRIIAHRDQHVALYDRMIEHLKSLKFEFEPPLAKHAYSDREDPGKDRLAGKIAPDKALAVLKNPSVAGIMLMPPDWNLPADADKPVRVRLELAGGFPLDRQRELAEQVRVLLRGHVGFREAVGYDHRGYGGRPFTRLAGTVPAGQLDLLLKDLRRLPTGWFAIEMDHGELPMPLRGVVPVLVTEILADDVPLVEPTEPEKRGPDFFDRVTGELWSLVKDKDQLDKDVRVQLVLGPAPRPGEKGWREALRRAAPSLFIEEQHGQFVTGIVRVRHLLDLAALPAVSTVRAPLPARPPIDPAIAIKTDNTLVLKQSGLWDFHKFGARGQGVKLAIIDTDFRGYEEMIKAKRLPARTQLVDLTIQKNFEMYPEPWPGDPRQLGHGTHCALAAALAAPQADLVLIRIDAFAPSQLYEAIRFFRGEPFSDYLDRRRDDIANVWGELTARRNEILKERRPILLDFVDDQEIMREYEFLGPVRGWIFSAREWSFQRLQYQDKEERDHKERESRFWKLVHQLRQLKDIEVAATPLVWNDGYPLGQASPLAKWFDDPAALSPSARTGKERRPLWFQAAGNVRGQCWNGLYRDDDGNGVMEFASAATPVAKERWTHEINFLAWQPWEGERNLDLPEKARVRLSLQWREPHDPDYYLRPGEEDQYRKPLAPLRLTVLRQRDPDGKGVAADSFDVVARSFILPERLDHLPTSSTYEQTVEFTVEKAGRYAVRIERQLGRQWMLRAHPGTGKPSLTVLEDLVAKGIRPVGTASLPGMEKGFDLRLRLFCQFLDEPARMAGRPVWVDYATDMGTLGVPSEARNIFTIGAVNLAGKPQPYSPFGPPANLELAKHPLLMTYDGLQPAPKMSGGAYGTSVAACYAAGAAACLISSGMTPADVRTYLDGQRGSVLRITPRR